MSRRLPLILCGALATLLLLTAHSITAAGTLLTALKNYRLQFGLFGSPFVGLDNFSALFERPSALMPLRNTFLFALAASACTGVLSAAALYGLRSVRRDALRFGLAALLFAPCALTHPMLGAGVLQGPMGPSALAAPAAFWLTAALQSLQLVPFIVLGGLVLQRVRPMAAGRMVGVAALASAACGWMTAFCGSWSMHTLLSSPGTYQWTDTLLSYQYRTGLLNAAYGQSAAGGVVRGLLGKTGLVAFGGCALCLLPGEPRPAAAENADGHTSCWPVLLFTLAALAALWPVGGWLQATAGRGLPQPAAPGSGVVPMAAGASSLILSMLFALLALLPGAALGWAVGSWASVGNRGTRMAVAVAAMLVLTSAGNVTIGAYLQRRSAGLLNMPFPPLDFTLNALLPLLTLLLCLPALQRTDGRDAFPRAALLCGGIVLLLGAVAIADPTNGVLYIARANILPLAALQRQLLMVGSAGPFAWVAPVLAGLIAGGVTCVYRGVRAKG